MIGWLESIGKWFSSSFQSFFSTFPVSSSNVDSVLLGMLIVGFVGAFLVDFVLWLIKKGGDHHQKGNKK